MMRERKNKSQFLFWSIGIGGMLLTGVLDYVTGPQVSVVPFYLIPIAVVAWWVGKRSGVVMGFLCALMWLLANVASQDVNAKSFTPYWNALSLTCGFTVVALLVHARHELVKRVEEMVEEKTVSLTAEVAERKRAEESIHRLAAQLSAAEDVQRRQLAQDIHDTLGQTLTVLKMNLERSIDGTTDPRSTRLRDSLSLIENMIQQTRTMTFELYPRMLDDLGLVPTVRRYGEQLQRQAGIQTTVSEIGGIRKIPTPIANYLFRAIKELMNNACKHGKAKEVLITVHWRGDAERGEVRVVVDDDGCGFDTVAALAPQSLRGLGLASIKERVASLGGKTDIESSAGNGTRVIVELPTSSDAVQGEVS
ncbi:MAG TPA: sensor histidine kinase [Phycisphaerae bacterium]|nr:sensor histidine kinase [Phycisphaerae bacterium]